MSRGPSYFGRRTPLPSEQKRQRRMARTMRFRQEDDRAGATGRFRTRTQSGEWVEAVTFEEEF